MLSNMACCLLGLTTGAWRKSMLVGVVHAEGDTW
jgi:hypothetical protein